MSFDPHLPVCPICSSPIDDLLRSTCWDYKPPQGRRRLRFQCGARYEAHADIVPDPSDTSNTPRLRIKPWGEWREMNQCSKASEIALDLLRKQSSS